MLGAAAMSLSSFCVVMNALRLNLFDVHRAGKDRRIVKNALGNIDLTRQNEDLPRENGCRKKNDASGNPEIASADVWGGENGKENGKENGEESDKMKKKLSIEGMMCGHCEATVKKALEGLDGVSLADVSHEKDQAVVSLEKEVSDQVLKETVEAKDYKVTAVTKL